jgi:uncharacterized protein (TIGR02147 family)
MDPIQIIIFEYQKRKQDFNESLRDFAKYIELDPSTLSKILTKRRGIPKSQAFRIARKLFQNENDQLLFVDSVLHSKKDSNETNQNDILKIEETDSRDTFFIISEWEYFAILNVLKLKNFDHTAEFISIVLNLPIKRVHYCLSILARNRFIIIEEDFIKRTNHEINTSKEVISRALRLAHLEELELAKIKIDLDLDQKYFSSDVFTIAKKDLPKLKKIIDRMYKECDRLTDTSESEEVYILSSQLFPLSQCQLYNTKTKKRNKNELH